MAFAVSHDNSCNEAESSSAGPVVTCESNSRWARWAVRGVVLLAALFVFLANVPASWPESIWTFDRCEHGWPAAFVVREVPAWPPNFWALTTDVVEFRPWALVLDVVVGMAIVIAARQATHWWFRRRREQSVRRRWYQFTLTRLLVILTVGLALLAAGLDQWRLIQYSKETRLGLSEISWLPAWLVVREKTWKWNVPPYHPLSSDFEPPNTTEQLKTIQYMVRRYPRQTTLYIDEELSPTEAKHVQQLVRMQSIVVHSACDRNLQALRPMTAVRQLYLRSDHRIASRRSSGDILANLRHMKAMEKLFIFGEPLDDAALGHLKNMPRLEKLHLTWHTGSFRGLNKWPPPPLPDHIHLRPFYPHGLIVDQQITDAGLVHLADLARLDSLRLEGTRIRGPGLVHLARLPRLRNLSLQNSQVDDDALAFLSECNSLRHLDLSNTNIRTLSGLNWTSLPKLCKVDVSGTAISYQVLQQLRRQNPQVEFTNEFFGYADEIRRGAVHQYAYLKTGPRITEEHVDVIAGLPRLNSLDMSYSDVRDSDLACVSTHPELDQLNLDVTHITDTGMEHLKNLQKLKTLSLAATPVNGTGLKWLQDMPHLTDLNVQDTAINDEGASHLAALKSLTSLHLDDTPLTDAGLAHVGQLTRLKYLRLQGTRISSTGLAQLQGLKDLMYVCLDVSIIDGQAAIELDKLPSLTTVELYYSGDAADAQRRKDFVDSAVRGWVQVWLYEQ